MYFDSIKVKKQYNDYILLMFFYKLYNILSLNYFNIIYIAVFLLKKTL